MKKNKLGPLALFGVIVTTVMTIPFALIGAHTSIAWLAVAMYGNLVLGAMTLGFYVGHFLEIAAVALVSIPAALASCSNRRRRSRFCPGSITISTSCCGCIPIQASLRQ